MALLVLGVEGDGAVEQGDHGLEAAGIVHRSGAEAQFQRSGQETQPFDVAPDAEQPPAVVAGHAVGLGAGDGSEVAAGGVEHPQGVQRLVVAFALVLGAAAEEFFLGVHDHLPVLFRQALAHGECGLFDAVEVVAHAAGNGGVGQAGDQGALEHPAPLGGHGHFRLHQHVVAGHLAQPGQQGHGRTAVAVEAVQREAAQAQGVFGAFGVAAQPEQVLGGPAGDDAFAVGQRGG